MLSYIILVHNFPAFIADGRLAKLEFHSIISKRHCLRALNIISYGMHLRIPINYGP